MKRALIRATRLLAFAVGVGFILFGAMADGGAQASSSLTVTVAAPGAVAGETFPVRVIIFDGEDIERELTAGVAETVDVAPGELAILQNPPAGWAFVGISCTGPEPFVPFEYTASPADPFIGGITLIAPDGVNVACTLTNVSVPTATVRLTESVAGIDTGPSVEHSVFVEPLDAMALPSGATIDIEVNAGPAFIVEEPAEGFGTFFIDCGDATVLNRFGSSVQVDLPADGLVECSIINVYAPLATLRIEKLTDVDAGGFAFPFRTGDLEFGIGPSFAPGFGGVEFALGAGPYEFVELPSDGWFLRSISCSGFGVELLEDGAPGFRVTPVQGGDVDCSFLNESLVGRTGDANCDGQIDIVDALVIAQFVVDVRTEAAQCPLGDVAGELFAGAADVDDSGSIDIVDALVIARCSAGLPAVLCPAG